MYVYNKLLLYHSSLQYPTENKHVVYSNQQFLHTWRPAILFTVIVNAAYLVLKQLTTSMSPSLTPSFIFFSLPITYIVLLLLNMTSSLTDLIKPARHHYTARTLF